MAVRTGALLNACRIALYAGFGCRFASNGSGRRAAPSRRGKSSCSHVYRSDSPNVFTTFTAGSCSATERNRVYTSATPASREAMSAFSPSSSTSSSVMKMYNPRAATLDRNVRNAAVSKFRANPLAFRCASIPRAWIGAFLLQVVDRLEDRGPLRRGRAVGFGSELIHHQQRCRVLLMGEVECFSGAF